MTAFEQVRKRLVRNGAVIVVSFDGSGQHQNAMEGGYGDRSIESLCSQHTLHRATVVGITAKVWVKSGENEWIDSLTSSGD